MLDEESLLPLRRLWVLECPGLAPLHVLLHALHTALQCRLFRSLYRLWGLLCVLLRRGQ